MATDAETADVNASTQTVITARPTRPTHSRGTCRTQSVDTVHLPGSWHTRSRPAHLGAVWHVSQVRCGMVSAVGADPLPLAVACPPFDVGPKPEQTPGLARVDGDGAAVRQQRGQASPLAPGAVRDWSELEGLLVELAPAWAEVRKLLNEINRVLAGAGRATGGPLAD